MDRDELEEKLELYTDNLDVMQLEMAQNMAKGMNQTDAYREVRPEDDNAKRNAHYHVRTNQYIRLYADTAKKIASLDAQELLGYSEADWMSDTLELLHMTMGKRKITETVMDGANNLGEVSTKSVNLNAAKGALELLGKRGGFFSESKKLEVKRDYEDLTDEEIALLIKEHQANDGE